MSPWTLELLLARSGPTSNDARALARDAERGRVARIRPGVYVERTGWEAFGQEERHVVAMRAFAAVASSPPVFSHWSAAVLHGLPVLSGYLDRVHIAVGTPQGRDLSGIAAHVLPDIAPVAIGTLYATAAARTVVEIARASPFAHGVVVADGALHAGLGRDALHDEVANAIGRRGLRRAQSVIAFARPEAESAAESLSRECMLRIGAWPPVLQHEVFDRFGLAGRLDFWFPWVRAGGEVDGVKKYLDPRIARGGTGQALVAEKWREDRVRREIDRLARWSWRESTSVPLLAPILGSALVLPSNPRANLTDYCTSFLAERL